jgi:hypothetical protein
MQNPSCGTRVLEERPPTGTRARRRLDQRSVTELAAEAIGRAEQLADTPSTSGCTTLIERGVLVPVAMPAVPGGQSWEPGVCQQLRGCSQNDRDEGWIQRRLAAEFPVQRLDCCRVGGHGNEDDRADSGLQHRL